MKAPSSEFRVSNTQATREFERGSLRSLGSSFTAHVLRLPIFAPRGFTLLEIMVALAILSLGIVTVLELLAGSLSIGVKASRYTQAAIYAQNIMDRAFAQTMLDDGEEHGEFPEGYTWVVRVREIHPDDDGARFQSNRPNQLDFFHLKEIEVQIAWDENGGGKTFVVRSLRAQTEQANAQNVPN